MASEQSAESESSSHWEDGSAYNSVWPPEFQIDADVAAAMLVAGNGRGRLSDTGWAALDAAMESDTTEDNFDGPITY